MKQVTRNRKIAIWAALVAIWAAAAVPVIRKTTSKDVRVLTGSILRDDGDPRKQVPITNAQIAVAENIGAAPVRSDSTGTFKLNLRSGVEAGDTLVLEIRHPDYEPLKIYENASEDLYTIRMTPIPKPPPPKPDGPPIAVANVRVRYAVTSTTTISVGSAVKTFEVVNAANVRCDHKGLCSPDGKWQAAVAGTTLDAGEGNEFEDGRLSCIAGPCGFTRIEHDGFSTRARTISVSVRNWSDTVSFLLEAQVVHTMTGDAVRQSYPVRFGSGMDFTLPVQAQGPSIEAEVGGEAIVYPLGPLLKLSWTTCSMTTDADGTRLYHCDLKAGYHFQ